MRCGRRVKGFTLIESLVSLSILSLIALMLFTAFIKFDNEQKKTDKAISLILMDKYEYLLRSNIEEHEVILSKLDEEAAKYGFIISSAIVLNEINKVITIEIKRDTTFSPVSIKKLILPHEK